MKNRLANLDSEEAEELVDDIKETTNEVNAAKKLPSVGEWCSTGCTILDLAVANQLPGGVPLGRIVHAFGGGSTAKTVLGVTILGYAQRTGKVAHMADVEHTLDQNFAKLYGLNCDDEKTFKLGYPETLEDMWDNYIGRIIYPNGPNKKMNTDPKIIVVDSITALPTIVELKEKMEEGTYGITRAKQMSKGFRKHIFPLATSNTTLFCIDQTRDNINITFGNKEVTSGGRALEFYSSVQIYLKHDCNIVTSKKVTVGIWVKFKIVKNKVAPPFREGRFKILFDYGLDDISTNINFLATYQLGPELAKNKSTKFELFGETKQIMNWTKFVEDNGLEEDLRKEVEKTWKEMYKTEERKPRIW